MKIKTRPFDMANHLSDEEEVAEYLRQVLEDGTRRSWPQRSVTLPVHAA